MSGNKFILKKALRASLVSLGMIMGASMVAGLTGHNPLVEAAHAESARMVKIGLHKSAVVRLPAGVKDILLGNPAVADVAMRSRHTMYVFARKLGQTNIFLLDKHGNPISNIELVVAVNTVPLQKMINEVLPEANIQVKTIENQILLTGTVKTPTEANKAMQLAKNFAKSFGAEMLATSSGDDEDAISVINALKITGKDQVMIKVRLAEVKRTVIKQMRTNLSEIKFSKGDLSGIMGFKFPFTLGDALTNEAGARFKVGGNPSIDGFLQLLERDSLMRMLAEPTLTAISGKPAKFIAGGEVPIVVSYDGLGNPHYQYKPYGVILGFTPVVLSEGRISLKVDVEVSEPQGRGFVKRSVQTTVELPSGGTLALAGMIQEKSIRGIDGLPGLKNVPILGALFRSNDFRSDQSELVVLATPYIVTPRNEKKFRTPVDRLNIASDMQAYFLGRLHKVYGGDTNQKGGTRVYHGDVGFILD